MAEPVEYALGYPAQFDSLAAHWEAHGIVDGIER
jgi:hypothetical protein